MTVASLTCSHAVTSSMSLCTPGWSRATRSSSETGADLWEIPTTRTLIFWGPRGIVGWRSAAGEAQDSVGYSSGCSLRLALLVVRQDLQLDGQVDLAYVDLVGDVQHRRCEVQDAGDTTGGHPVRDVLRGD